MIYEVMSIIKNLLDLYKEKSIEYEKFTNFIDRITIEKLTKYIYKTRV